MVISRYNKGDIVPDFLVSSSENCGCIVFNVDVEVMNYPESFKLKYGLYIDAELEDLRDVFRVIPKEANKFINIRLDQVFIWPGNQKDLTDHIKTNLDEGIICACLQCRNKFGYSPEVKRNVFPAYAKQYFVTHTQIEKYRLTRKLLDKEGYYIYSYEK